jgi:hypothetical protein
MLNFSAHHGDPCDGWPGRLSPTGLAYLLPLVRPLTFSDRPFLGGVVRAVAVKGW